MTKKKTERGKVLNMINCAVGCTESLSIHCTWFQWLRCSTLYIKRFSLVMLTYRAHIPDLQSLVIGSWDQEVGVRGPCHVWDSLQVRKKKKKSGHINLKVKAALLWDHRSFEILTSLCPDIVFSNLPSYAPHIFINLSAAGWEEKQTNKQHCH